MPCVRRLEENAKKAKAAPSKHHTHVNSVAFLCVAKCGVKGLALMNGTARLCRNEETELFLYCISERIREKVAAQNVGGLPSRPAFPSSPGAVLTVGG